jgi:hypothetical protein
MIWPQSTAQQKLGELYALNLTEDQLRERFVRPYQEGRPITWDGRTLPPSDVARITIGYTEDAQSEVKGGVPDRRYRVVTGGEDVTNDWIVGPPGSGSTQPEPSDSGTRNPKRVMVVHGRNAAARDAMFTFLRAVGLEPIEWEQAVGLTGAATPHNLDAVRAAMSEGQAVVVILTAEDHARLLPELAGENDDDEQSLRGQPRQNVILEAGLAMGIDRNRTILVELGANPPCQRLRWTKRRPNHEQRGGTDRSTVAASRSGL